MLKDFKLVFPVWGGTFNSMLRVSVYTGIQMLLVNLYMGYIPFTPPYHAYYLTVPGTAILLSVVFLCAKKVHWVFGVASVSLWTLVLYGDILYYRYYGAPLTASLISLHSNVDGMLVQSIWALIKPADVFLSISMLATFFEFRNTAHSKIPSSLVAMYVLIGLVLSSAKYAYTIIRHQQPFVVWADRDNYINYSPAGFHFVDLIRHLQGKESEELSDNECLILKDWRGWKAGLSEKIDTGLFGSLRGASVVVLQIESLGGFLVGAKRGGNAITPNVDRLAAEGMYFSKHHSQNSMGGSSDAEFVFFTGLLPPYGNAAFIAFPDLKVPTFPKWLREQGYSTSAFHANLASYWGRGRSYPAMGIDSLNFCRQILSTESRCGDAEMFDFAAKRIAEYKKPFFAQIITIEGHVGGYSDVDGYFDEIRKVDSLVGAFLKKIESMDVVVVLYGDHPPPLDYQKAQQKHSWVRSETPKVPLIIRSARLKPRIIDKFSGQVDLFPTLAYLMGDSAGTEQRLVGRNLFDTSMSFVITRDSNLAAGIIDQTSEKWLRESRRASDLIIREAFHK